MKFFYIIFKLLLYTFIFLGIFNSSYSKTLNFNQDAKSVSSYFSGIVAFDDVNYESSHKFLKNFARSEEGNENFSNPGNNLISDADKTLDVNASDGLLKNDTEAQNEALRVNPEPNTFPTHGTLY